MSIESAMAALSTEAPIIDSKAPTSPVQGVPRTQGTQEVPKTLQEAVTPVKTETKPQQPGSDRFAALAKKERALQKQMVELKQQQAKVSEWEKARQQATQNPIKALEMLGLSYEQITQFMLNGQKPTPELEMQSIKQEIEKLRTETAEKERIAKQAQEQAAKAEYQRTLAEFSQEISDFVKTNADTYELTAMYQGEAIVQATIEQHFANTKKILSVKEAADLVEKYFEDQVAAAQKAKKFQAKQTPKEDGQSKREPGTKQSSPTLSNEMTSSAPSLLPAKTEQDRISRAMAALNRG